MSYFITTISIVFYLFVHVLGWLVRFFQVISFVIQYFIHWLQANKTAITTRSKQLLVHVISSMLLISQLLTNLLAFYQKQQQWLAEQWSIVDSTFSARSIIIVQLLMNIQQSLRQFLGDQQQLFVQLSLWLKQRLDQDAQAPQAKELPAESQELSSERADQPVAVVQPVVQPIGGRRRSTKPKGLTASTAQ